MPTVILSTCNRTEIFFSLPVASTISKKNKLLTILKIPSSVKKYFRFRHGQQATKNLFQITAGLASPIPGENQILAQVREAYKLANSLGSCDTVLHSIFQQAIACGKRVRSETKINQGNLSIGSVAVELARKIYPDLKNKKIILAGFGEVNRLILKFLAKKNVREIKIFTRRSVKIQNEIKKYHAIAYPFKQIFSALKNADILFTATAAPKIIFKKDDFIKQQKPLLIFDLAIPRDCDEKILNLKLIQYYNVDDIQKNIVKNLQSRQTEIIQAKQIIKTALRKLKQKNIKNLLTKNLD